MQLYDPKFGKLNDFRNFLILVWAFLKLSMPDSVQLDMAHFLQVGPNALNSRIVIEAFRGVGKTWITAAFACWCLMMNPNLKILIVSKTKEKAQEISVFMRKLLREHPLLCHLNPDSGDNRGQNTMTRFDIVGCNIAVAPSVKVEGIKGAITGSRADIIIADDVETPANSATAGERDNLEGLVKEFDAVLSPGGWIIYLGTPQTEQTLYSKLEKKGYTLRVWPIRYPSDAQIKNPTYFGRLAPMVRDKWTPALAWKPIGVARFPEAEILSREAQGHSWFMLQYMLDPSLSDETRYPLKLRDLIVMSLNADTAPVQVDYAAVKECVISDPSVPNIGMEGDRLYGPFHIAQHAWLPYEFKVLTVDPSGSGADETGYCVGGVLKGKIYWLASGGTMSGYDNAALEELANVAKKFKVTRVLVEENFGDGMYSKLLGPVMARIHPTTIEDIHVSGQKELRIIDTVEPALNQHRIVACLSMVRNDFTTDDARVPYQVLYQLTRITRQKKSLRHDDRLDAFYLMVWYCIKSMGQDDSTSAEEHQQTLMDERLARFGRKYREGTSGGRDLENEGNWLRK